MSTQRIVEVAEDRDYKFSLLSISLLIPNAALFVLRTTEHSLAPFTRLWKNSVDTESPSDRARMEVRALKEKLEALQYLFREGTRR